MLILRQIGVARAPLFAFAAMGVLWGAYAALVPDTKAMLGASDAGFGSLMLATPIAAVVAMLAAPRIARALGRHVLPVSVLAMALAFLLPGWFAVPALFALAMVLVGATNGLLDVTMNARVVAIEAEHGLHLMNLNHAGYSFGYAASAIATGWARSQGFGPAEVLGTAALAIALLSFLAIERGGAVNGFAGAARIVGGLGAVPVWGGVVVLIAFMAENAAEGWSALHIERTLGGSPAEGSFGPAVLALTMGVGRLVGQVVVARTDEAWLMRWGTVTGAAGMALAGLAPGPFWAYAGLAIAGLGASVIAPTAYAAIGRMSAPDRRALVIARATALGYLGYFFGPPALGLISQIFGLRVAFVAMAVMVLLVTRLYPRLIAAGRRQRSPALPDGRPCGGP